MPWFAIIGLVCFVIGCLGLVVLCVSRWDWDPDRPAPTPDRPQTGARVIRDPRFGLERHEHDWRGDEE